ncbi:MAG: DUF192 domain-containing protein [Candidatus Micrarchaeaceae archaeon]
MACKRRSDGANDGMGFSPGLFRPRHYATKHALIGNRRIKVFVADTFMKKMYGLTSWNSIKNNEGMLFPISSHAESGIWMRGMKFSIDILWLDRSGKVIDVVERAKPCRLFNCGIYYPEGPASYVLELAAGAAKRMHIRKGTRIFVK